ncbi:sterol reductase [Chloropicon primus]|uniref:7-dehydrocholesterol reductase n=1 Tax=Chloropicon primus TaxID=1764295 RepID=A0A5B8MSY4_9CHLO|nr:sterol reductase [Chloropicon primus]|eukprot:QDZ23633.1 sterol reductase [Chloropicon primus]
MGMAKTTRKSSRARSPSPQPKRTPRKTPAKRKTTASKGSVSWSDSAGTGVQDGGFLRSLGALLLLVTTPPFTMALWSIFVQHKGSVTSFGLQVADSSNWPAFSASLPTVSWEATSYIAAFGAFQAFLQLAVPGKEFIGPVSPKGNRPVYKANGVECFFLTLIAFFLGWRYEVFSPARVYDQFGEILNALNIFALVLCLFLTVKGCNFPSSTDSGTTGSFLFDYFWGTELYPRIGKSFDIKQWTNCRMGLMGWSVLPLCFMAKQLEATGSVSNSMLICVVLTNIYVFKFFLWETGYFCTMDIAHDRAGFYICWGCLVWVPSVYTSPALHLVQHPINLPNPVALAILGAGTLMIYINWAADEQKKIFRATGGKCKVWGKEPKYITAKYKPGKGQTKTSLLLLSGWWGIARHFHYIPEILSSVFWTIPAGFDHIMPWFYVIFLTILLFDRAFRDEARCAAKYGKFWDAYCAQVPYRFIPGLL